MARCFFTFIKVDARYLSQIPTSPIILDLTIKRLIASQKYEEALDLFDRRRSQCTNVTFTLALKACTKLSDYDRGIRIHQQLSSYLLEDPFIQASLIHFYSKLRSLPFISLFLKLRILLQKYFLALCREFVRRT